MEKFYINQDGTVDVTIDIATNNIVTLSGDLFAEVAYKLSEKNVQIEMTPEKREQFDKDWKEMEQEAQKEREAIHEMRAKEMESGEWDDNGEYDRDRDDNLINEK